MARRQGVGRGRQVDDEEVPRDRRRGRRRHPAGRRVRRFVAERRRRAPRPLRARLRGHRAGDAGGRWPRARSAPAPAWSRATSRPASAPSRAGSQVEVRHLHRRHPGAVELRRHANLRVDGAPVGEMLAPQFATPRQAQTNAGSIITIIAHRRAAAVVAAGAPVQAGGARGSAALGSFAAHGSGEIIVGVLDGQQRAAPDARDDATASTSCSTRDRTRSTRRSWRHRGGDRQRPVHGRRDARAVGPRRAGPAAGPRRGDHAKYRPITP